MSTGTCRATRGGSLTASSAGVAAALAFSCVVKACLLSSAGIPNA